MTLTAYQRRRERRLPSGLLAPGTAIVLRQCSTKAAGARKFGAQPALATRVASAMEYYELASL